MRKIVAGLFISLDGVVEAPEQWTGPYFGEDVGQLVGSMIAGGDTLLLGRVTDRVGQRPRRSTLVITKRVRYGPPGEDRKNRESRHNRADARCRADREPGRHRAG